MKLSKFLTLNKERTTIDNKEKEQQVKNILKNAEAIGEPALTTRQISNIIHKVQNLQDAVKNVDKKTLTTKYQDSILEGVLNPMLSRNILVARFIEGNKVFALSSSVRKVTKTK